MYTLLKGGALRAIETWSAVIPLHDNNNVAFPPEVVDAALQEVKSEFPAFTILRCRGVWNGPDGECVDENLLVTVDMPVSSRHLAWKFFLAFKVRIGALLKQEKIYICRRQAGEELLTTAELLSELRSGRSAAAIESVSPEESVLPAAGDRYHPPALPAGPAYHAERFNGASKGGTVRVRRRERRLQNDSTRCTTPRK